MTVFVYVNTSKQVGDVDHLKVFATAEAAETWFEETIPKAWPLSMRFWSNRIGLTIETALAHCASEPPTLEVYFRSETFGRRKPEALNRLRQSNIVPIPLLKEPTLSGRVY